MAGAWLGLLLSVAFLAAPVAFAVLSKDMAGLVVGRLFAREAALSLMLSVLFVMALRKLSEPTAQGADELRALGTDPRLWATLGVMVCTLLGYYALQPMMAAARVGQGTLSFGALHGISVGFFGLKILLLSVLTWRLSRSASIGAQGFG